MKSLWCIALLAGNLVPAWAALPTTTFPEHPGAAITMDMEPGACVPVVPVVISTKNPEAFQRGSDLPDKALAWARQTAGAMCPNVSRIELTGLLNNSVAYESVAHRANNWALVRPMETPVASAAPAAPQGPAPRVAQASPPSQGAPRPGNTPPPRTSSAAANAVARCDDLASHPEDPEAVGAGVADDAINAASAVPACEAAIKAEPGTPRLHFQLARAYLSADKMEEAIEELVEAAEADHGGALAYLADMHLSGAPGIEVDPVTARNLLEKAVASGFTPAKKVLDEFEDMTEDFKQATGTGPAAGGGAGMAAAPTSYRKPDIIQNVLQRRYDQVPGGEKYAKQYLANIADNIAAICKRYFTEAEVQQLHENALINVFNFTGAEQAPFGQPKQQIDHPRAHDRHQSDGAPTPASGSTWWRTRP